MWIPAECAKLGMVAASTTSAERHAGNPLDASIGVSIRTVIWQREVDIMTCCDGISDKQ